MVDGFVSEKQSLELRDIGFYKTSELGEEVTDYPVFSVITSELGEEVKSHFMLPITKIEKPFFTQVFRWFNEKHDLHCGVIKYDKQQTSCTGPVLRIHPSPLGGFELPIEFHDHPCHIQQAASDAMCGAWPLSPLYDRSEIYYPVIWGKFKEHEVQKNISLPYRNEFEEAVIDCLDKLIQIVKNK